MMTEMAAASLCNQSSLLGSWLRSGKLQREREKQNEEKGEEEMKEKRERHERKKRKRETR